MVQLDTLPIQCRHIEHMHEGVVFKQINIDKWQLLELRHFFQLIFNRGYACAIIVHTRADQLLPQFLMEQFDTLTTQWRHIDYMHEEVWFTKINYWRNNSWPINFYRSFWWSNLILWLHNVDTMSIWLKIMGVRRRVSYQGSIHLLLKEACSPKETLFSR